jgi:2,3-bisphosphoglycerate-dependent phosphoglycerate mutase
MLKMLTYFTIAITCFSCTKNIYIVRHAEKQATVKDNPPLTTEGAQRAEVLAKYLNNKNVNIVYSTNTNRTINTAKPFANKHNLTVNLYNNDTAQKTLQSIVANKKNALVVGHSNTILHLLIKMGITPPKTDVPDWEYDNLFVVKYKRYCYDCTNPFVIKKVFYKKYGNLSKPILIEPSKKM